MRDFSLKIVICAFLLVVLSAGFAYAQWGDEVNAMDMDPQEKSMLAEKVFKELPASDQNTIMAEVKQVDDFCQQRGLYTLFHDCECIASKFFEERVINPDPMAHLISTADKFSHLCPNVPGVAGYAYENCYNMNSKLIPHAIEPFCECYANEYAKVYAEYPSAHKGAMTSMGTNALLACDQKGLASPLHPNR